MFDWSIAYSPRVELKHFTCGNYVKIEKEINVVVNYSTDNCLQDSSWASDSFYTCNIVTKFASVDAAKNQNDECVVLGCKN